jgi:hypothetical protein
VYLTLTRTNYTEWSLVMKVNLQAAGLWDVIEFGAGDYRDDRTALAAILRAVPPEMQAGLAVRPTPSACGGTSPTSTSNLVSRSKTSRCGSMQ